ncbi:nitroreductase family protein [uncultured Eubacterium sp.]|uniref:nitroreductase family protein n=1 Tax=uncultured Eubacterium sp. TaxID=165185 RepID=UPI0025936DCF|nr:nitroreductase family protein [uncultured Eubacterium sp.]
MEFLELAKKRYSCRSISDKPVEDEKIEKILKAGMLAPTAVNFQPFKIWVVKSKEGVEKIGEITTCTFGAPLFFVVGGLEESAWNRKYDGKNFADVDASIVATHMMLEVEDLGLASTWVANFDAVKIKELFPEMADYNLIAMFPVGYANSDAKPSDRHELSKSRDELVKEL